MGLVMCLTSTNELTCTTQNWFSVLYFQASGVRALKEQCTRLCLVHPWEHHLWADCSWWKCDWIEVLRWGTSNCTSAILVAKPYPMAVPTPTAPDHGRAFRIRSMPRHLPDLYLAPICLLLGQHSEAVSFVSSHREGPRFESTSQLGPYPWVL